MIRCFRPPGARGGRYKAFASEWSYRRSQSYRALPKYAKCVDRFGPISPRSTLVTLSSKIGA
jgi:hypothetical protein